MIQNSGFVSVVRCTLDVFSRILEFFCILWNRQVSNEMIAGVSELVYCGDNEVFTEILNVFDRLFRFIK